ncbi:SDR family oxidoreductase [Gluconobacter kanchanaburiensis]|uniref:Gluconate 5-dehydrogenase n=1 Tax=Gluconobacter kanchanaburiensis NBRC 103587 TaxID=1307948 RepID=A0A511B8T9_9PROT|nr:SDR family oxidoreductase [Gluconobacter kanchanaburiensis]MBF0862642.1 SDR family oxidoreductase [Gluconobacter kanchanaburiensis]GBR71862.1 gluconate 5-dehydrogenase [Gluconobacter kanchanaburiensis NBRC 103587]GEK96860.1 gluconate 5-dehydrogenase [Gluconobacter kanchanaburiensis NBRC 103587]
MTGPDLFSLAGHRALLTGASRGIGLTLAKGLARYGAEVVLNGRNEEALKVARAGFDPGLPPVSVAAFDVTDQNAVEEGVGRIEKEMGPIDILINNAGIQRRAPLEDFSRKDWDDLISTNLNAVFFVGQAVARHMIPRARGKIVNICSVQSELARPGIAPYTATKGAVRNLTRGMATDWGRHGLQINGLAPGYFATEMTERLVADEGFSEWLSKRTPAGRWGQVDELVGAAVFLSSPASSFINGHMLMVDGGISISL